MNKTGPIVVIEDDLEDEEILRLVFKELEIRNELVFFQEGSEALEYLQNSQIKPFLVLSDINMPKLSGVELRKQIQENSDLSIRCIPYLFFTTHAEQKTVIDAYSQSVQGFFVKPHSHAQIKRVISNIVEYWRDCESPNSYM